MLSFYGGKNTAIQQKYRINFYLLTLYFKLFYIHISSTGLFIKALEFITEQY